ncbi:hypothetical protein ACSX1C_19915 [Pseudomonas sp. MBLB4123]|uniref:hypothetical protein n=1 Tax=Pseudomonas sp. MBLB4123 TaxID=3451557 RepID=UPI003F75647D
MSVSRPTRVSPALALLAPGSQSQAGEQSPSAQTDGCADDVRRISTFPFNLL